MTTNNIDKGFERYLKQSLKTRQSVLKEEQRATEQELRRIRNTLKALTRKRASRKGA